MKSDSIIAAALGGEANLCCNFSLSMDVLQVTWQKKNGSSFLNIATYSPNHGLRMIGLFEKKVHFTRATLKASAITLQNLTFEDESYYRCIFNVFPHGSFSKDICLNIQSKFSTNTFSLSSTQHRSDVVRSWALSPPLHGHFPCSSISLVDSLQNCHTFLREGEGK